MLTKEHPLFGGRKPWDHQLEAINKAYKSLTGYAFLFEPGCGKTWTLINSLRLDCIREGRFLKTLIIAPVIVLDNFKREILEFSKFDPKKVLVAHGPQKKRVEIVKKLQESGDGIILTNYNALSTMKDFVKSLHEWAPDVLVLDESHRCKDTKSKQTKAAIKLSDVAKKKYLLTGTPILNSLEDLWSQFRILDGGETLGKSLIAFRNAYFTNVLKHANVTFPRWVEKQGAREVVKDLIKDKAMFVEKETALDLPPFIQQTIHVELSGDAKKAYKDMQKELIAFVNEAGETPEAATAPMAMIKALRLLQITTGHVGTETAEGEKKLKRFKNNPKKDALKELLTDLTPKSKVIVWSVFKENYADIKDVCEKIGVQYVEVHGSNTKEEKDDAISAFERDPDIRVFISNPASGGIGVNLVSSDSTIYYSKNFSLENDLQSVARFYRGGSEIHKKVTRYDLVAKGTIDEQVTAALSDKKEIGFDVLRGMLK